MVQGTRSVHISREDAAWLLGSVPQIFWIAGADGKICFLSERFTDLTGLDATEVIKNDRWKDVVYPEDLPSLEALWRNARAGASESRSYFRMRFRSGRYHWMHSVGRPVLSSHSGGITHWVGGLVDVDAELSAQRSVEEMNRELHRRTDPESDVVSNLRWRFRSLFHDRNIGVLEIDLAAVKRHQEALLRAGAEDLPRLLERDPSVLEDLIGRAGTVEINQALVKMLGFQDEEASLLGHGELLSRMGASNPVRLAIRALFAGKDALEGVAELDTAIGGRVTVAYAINISDDVTCYATLVDISEQKKAAEVQLAVQSELARANRAATIGALSVSIAHELNQPITTMRIELRSLEQAISALGVQQRPIQDGLDRLTRQCERLTGIIQRTRDRMMDHGRRIEQVDLAGLAKEIPVLLHRELGEARVRLEVRTPGYPCCVRADVVEMQQVLVNLLLNAIEATMLVPMDERRVQLCIDRTGDFARVRVRDFGCGIEEENLTKIFDPFFTTKPGGVGMGLQICRTIVEALGGDLQAKNLTNGGVLFEFCIPNATDNKQS